MVPFTRLPGRIAFGRPRTAVGQRRKTFRGPPDPPNESGFPSRYRCGAKPGKLRKRPARSRRDESGRLTKASDLGEFGELPLGGVGCGCERFVPLAEPEPRTAAADTASQAREEAHPTPPRNRPKSARPDAPARTRFFFAPTFRRHFFDRPGAAPFGRGFFFRHKFFFRRDFFDHAFFGFDPAFFEFSF